MATHSFLPRISVAFVALLFCITSSMAAVTGYAPEGYKLASSGKPVQIAEGGKAMLPIVISPDASKDLRASAEELAGFLKRMTGAAFTIKESKVPEGITLGTLSQFPDDKLKKDLEIRDGYDGVEAFVIRSGENRVLLLANTDLGASHAAYRFLELLGCRWFFMGKTWEVVPQIQSLSFDLNESSRPRIWSRIFGFTRLNLKVDEVGDPDRAVIFQDWKKANRMAKSFEASLSHAWHAIPNSFKMDGYPFKKEFEAHPEYFALLDGKRTPPQFCVTNPGLQKVITEYANFYFKKNPEADAVSLDTADQAGWCTCPECTKLGHHSVQPFFLTNLVGKELQKTHPGKFVGLLAYSWHCDPPSFAMEPNVFVQLTNGFNASKYTFDELFKAWGEKCQHMGIYEYYSYWEMDKCMLPGNGPHNKIDELGTRMKKYADNKVVYLSAESASSWGAHGLGYYIANRMLWDPDADIKALKRDFYDKAFGPAAPAMERYYERLNLSNRPFRGQSLLRQCLGDLEEAVVLAKSRPDVLARLDDLRANMVYNYLGQKVESAENEAEQKRSALEWFTWSYRMRNNHMVDWLTFRATVGNDEYDRSLACKFKEPSWNYRKTSENPWKNDVPVTSQELTERLQKIKAEWGEVPSFSEQKYSDKYVLVRFDGSQKREGKRAFLGSAVQLLVSQKGEPLSFKLTSTPSPSIERQDAKYSLATLDGKEIIKGELPEGENPMNLKVPGPGIYLFTCKRGGSGWWIELPDELNSAIIIKRELESRPQYMKSYFYVPKKTSRIVMYSQDGSVSVSDPANKVAYKGKSKGEFTLIPVKDGMDGKVWSITGKFRNLCFLNIPTVLSASPSYAFVPKELVEKDALEEVLLK
ncbi:MAG TPA: hypothetical protein DET40_06900 [Lentisphaeria bacterium]|nr:MAG: hypothetical protein A2X45_07400 [Lentisphaerae bacterium GWF2_50_93]HCE43258.1 hypothetical protein [Lentisphaeria bacterium]